MNVEYMHAKGQGVIDLPRAHALMFARFAQFNYMLPRSWLRAQRHVDQDYIEEDVVDDDEDPPTDDATPTTVDFLCHFPDGPRGERLVSQHSITLPRWTALLFARWCYHGGTPEGPFGLSLRWLDSQSSDDQDYIKSNPPEVYFCGLPVHVYQDGRVL